MISQKNEIPNPGKFDPDFGIGRPVQMKSPDPSVKFQSNGVAVDDANNIYVVGLLFYNRFLSKYCCVKLTAKGQIDRDFGEQGYVTGQFSLDTEEAHSHAHEVKVLRDGKILITGIYRPPMSEIVYTALLRLHPNGQLDEEFGNNGELILDLVDHNLAGKPEPKDQSTSSSDHPTGANTTITPDGKILLFDVSNTIYGEYQTRLVRLTPDGKLDTSFNEKGFVNIVHPEYPKTTKLDRVLITETGNYVLMGQVGIISFAAAAITQLHDTGELDTSFANNGYLLIDRTPSQQRMLFGLTHQTNKRILGLGVELPSYLGLLISREPDGKANIQFNRGEPVTQSLAGSTSFSTASMQSDGKILVLGSIINQGDRYYSTALARFTAAGELDLTYGNGTGWYLFELIPSTRLSAVFMSEKILFLGMEIIDDEEYYYLARVLIK